MSSDAGAPAEKSVATKDRSVDQTLARTAMLLDAFAAARGDGLRFTDLVTVTGLGKATIHRLLAGLVGQGFVQSDPESRRYSLGFRLAEWGAAARGRHGVVEHTAPRLRGLAEQLGDTVYLSLRDGPLALCAALYEGPSPIRAVPIVPGDRNALGVGSGSLALLAVLPDEEIDRVIADARHAEARARRGVDAEAIRGLVDATRRRGYALVDDLTPGITALAMPLPGSPRAAVSVASVHDRLREPRRGEVVARLRVTLAGLAGL